MTCASCAARVEKELAKVPGVDSATVNSATEVATVHYRPAQTKPGNLTAAVEGIGYSARLPQAAGHTHDGGHRHGDDDPAIRDWTWPY